MLIAMIIECKRIVCDIYDMSNEKRVFNVHDLNLIYVEFNKNDFKFNLCSIEHLNVISISILHMFDEIEKILKKTKKIFS